LNSDEKKRTAADTESNLEKSFNQSLTLWIAVYIALLLIVLEKPTLV
jgi:hypothetical protein